MILLNITFHSPSTVEDTDMVQKHGGFVAPEKKQEVNINANHNYSIIDQHWHLVIIRSK